MTDYETIKSILDDATPTYYQDQWIDGKQHDDDPPELPALELDQKLMIVFTQEGKYSFTTSRY